MNTLQYSDTDPFPPHSVELTNIVETSHLTAEELRAVSYDLPTGRTVSEFLQSVDRQTLRDNKSTAIERVTSRISEVVGGYAIRFSHIEGRRTKVYDAINRNFPDSPANRQLMDLLTENAMLTATHIDGVISYMTREVSPLVLATEPLSQQSFDVLRQYVEPLSDDHDDDTFYTHLAFREGMFMMHGPHIEGSFMSRASEALREGGYDALILERLLRRDGGAPPGLEQLALVTDYMDEDDERWDSFLRDGLKLASVRKHVNSQRGDMVALLDSMNLLMEEEIGPATRGTTDKANDELVRHLLEYNRVLSIQLGIGAPAVRGAQQRGEHKRQRPRFNELPHPSDVSESLAEGDVEKEPYPVADHIYSYAQRAETTKTVTDFIDDFVKDRNGQAEMKQAIERAIEHISEWHGRVSKDVRTGIKHIKKATRPGELSIYEFKAAEASGGKEINKLQQHRVMYVVVDGMIHLIDIFDRKQAETFLRNNGTNYSAR